MRQGYSVLFTMAAALVTTPVKGQAEGRLEQRLARLSKPKLLIVGEWGTALNDPVVTAAILDRLLHHSHVLTIRGDSDWLREERRSGLLKSAPPPAQAGASS